jgi:hypothetical protein
MRIEPLFDGIQTLIHRPARQTSHPQNQRQKTLRQAFSIGLYTIVYTMTQQ